MEEILELCHLMQGAILPILVTCVIAVAISHYRFMRQKTVSLGTAVTSMLLGPTIALSVHLTYHHTWEIFNLLFSPPEPGRLSLPWSSSPSGSTRLPRRGGGCGSPETWRTTTGRDRRSGTGSRCRRSTPMASAPPETRGWRAFACAPRASCMDLATAPRGGAADRSRPGHGSAGVGNS